VAVTFVANSAVTSSADASGTSKVTNFPSFLTDDIVFAFISFSTTDTGGNPVADVPTPPAGWTQIASLQSQTGNGTPVSLHIFYRVAVSDNEFTSETFVTDISTGHASIGAVYRGQDLVTPIDVQANGTQQVASPYSTPSVTTTVDNVMVIRQVVVDDNNALNLTTPTDTLGYARRFAVNASAPGDGISGATYDFVEPTAGATGTDSVSWTIDTGEEAVGFVFGIRPASVQPSETFTIDAILLGAPVERVQRGTVSFAGTSTDVTIPSAVVLANSFLIFQYNVDTPDVDEVNVRGQITSPTNIHFERTTAGVTVDISWYVVEDSTRISSQRGNLTMASTTENETITSVDLAKSFSLASWENPGASWGDGDTIRHRLTSATNLEFLIDTLPGGFEPEIDWEVTEFTGAVVQRGITTFASGTASEDIVITSVDLSRSIVHISNTINGALAVTPNIQGLSGELTTSTNLHIERDGTGNSMEIAWKVIEFPSDVKVQSGVESLGTTQTVANVAITSVDLNKTAVLISHHMKGGRTSDSSDDNPHTVWYKAELTTATNLQLTRALSDTSTGDVAWYVIELGAIQPITHTFLVDALLQAQGDNGNCGARIQTAVATLAIGVTSLAVTIDPINMGTSFLIFNQNEASTDTNQFNVFGEITNSTTLTFTRKANAGTDISVAICWYIVDYPESISVQRGVNVMATATVNQTITAVDILQSFPIQSFQNDGTLWGADDAVRARLTSSTNLELMSTLAITDNLAWQVVEYTGASVQRGIVTFASGGLTSTDITITAVDRTRSFAIVTASKSATSTPANAGLTAELTTDTNLHIERASNSGNAQDIAWFVIELPSNVKVQFGTETLGTTQTVANIAINPIKQDNTISFLSHNFKGGRGGESVDQDPSTIWYTSELTTSTNLRLTRGASSSSISDVSWFVIEFGPVQHACALVDAILSPREDFDVDAILQATFDEDFDVDAILVATFDEDFEVDGVLILLDQEETFEVDARLRATFIEEFTVDARVALLDQEETFEVGARLLATFDETFEVNGLIKAFDQEETFEVDGLVVTENQKIFNIDGLIQDTFDEEFFVDSILRATFTEDFTVDARLSPLEEFEIDALIQTQDIEETFDVDAVLQATFDEEFDVDGVLQATFIEEFEVDARLRATFIEEFDIDAVLVATFIEEFDVDAVLQATFIEEFTVDARLVATFDEEFDTDAILQATFIEEFDVNAVLQATFTEDFTVDARLVNQPQETFEVDAILRGEQTHDFRTDAVLQADQTEMFEIDSILLGAGLLETFDVNAVIKAFDQEETFFVDAQLAILNQEEEFDINAVLQATFIEEFDTDAIVQATFTEDFRVDARLVATFDEEFFVDAVLRATFIEEFDVDSVLQATFIEEFFVDAILLQVNIETFKVNAIVAVRHTFTIDSILVRQITTEVDSILKGTINEDFFIGAILIEVPSTLTEVDGCLVVVNEETFEVNAVLSERKTETFKIDSILKATFIEEFDVNALLAERKDEEFFVDARLQATFIEEFDINAVLQATFDEEFFVDGVLILLNQEETFEVDARVKAFAQEEKFRVDGLVEKPTNEETFFVDGIVALLDQEETFFVDGVLTLLDQEETFEVDAQLFGILTFDEEFEVDAVIKAFAQEKTFKVSAILIEIPSVLTEVNGLLQTTFTEDFKIGARVAFVNEETFEVDAQLKAIETFDEEFKVDGLIQALAQEKEFFVDGLTNIVPKETFKVDARLQATFDEEFFVDAHIRLIGEEEFEINAQLVANVPEKETFFVNAIVGFFTKINVDALLQATFEHEFTVDTVILTPVKFTVDALIKRLGDNCSSGLIFNDPIEANTGWVVNNGLGVQIRVDGANFPKKIEYDRLGNFAPGFLYKLLNATTPTINSLGNIRLDFKYNHTFTELGGSDGGMLMGLTDAGGKIIESSRFGARHVRSGGQFQLKAQMSDGTTTVETSTVDIPNILDTFITIEKIGSSIRLNAYSDKARTVHTGGSPTPFVSVVGLNQIIFDRIGGSGGNPTVLSVFIETGILDDIQVYGNICTNFRVDGLIEAPKAQEEFEINAVLVPIATFEIDALIKAIGDIRCLPSFAEKIFEDDLADTSNWSSEIVNTNVDGWGDEQIFIDGETIASEDIIRMTMEPGGPNPTSLFKSRYRRKFIGSEGGVGVVSGDNFRMEFELHQVSKGEGSWIGLNRTGFHPQNDPNTSTFQLNSGDGEVTATLGDGVNSVTTPPLIWNPAGEESPDSLFMVIESVGGQLILNAYDDAGHTLHNGNSPVSVSTSTIDKDDLRMFWLFVGANNKLADASDPIADAEIDNILIYADPCPIIRVDAVLFEEVKKEFEFTINARLIGRKDFTIDAKLVGQTKFDINAILTAPIILEFRINALLKIQDEEIGFDINAILLRGARFTVDGIFSTEPSAPNFSLTHMQSIIHMFSGIVDVNFTINAQLRGSISFTIDAKLVTPVTFSINAVLSTEPQPLFFSLTHLQDIVPLVSISEEVTTEVDALIKKFDQEKEFRVNASLILRFDEEFEVNAQLSQITKTVKPIIDSLLEGTLEEEFRINSILVNRFAEEPLVNAILKKFNIEEEFRVHAILKGTLDEDFRINAIIVEKIEFTVEVDAVIKRFGEDGSCNFFPATNTIGTGLEQFVGPNTPSHESDVDLFIGQQFNLNNQQIRKVTILLRATGFPNEITSPSLITGKIWSNVVKGNLAGEVVKDTSINTIDVSVDLPAGVWTEVTFNFVDSPFLTGDFLIGFQHAVGTGINDPQGVGVARPVISGGNVIAGEALFRRESNSAFIDPTKWRFVIGDLIDMVINIELINGDEIILGKGKQCPHVNSILIVRNIEEYSVNAIIVNRFKEVQKLNAILVNKNIEEFNVNAILSPLKEFEIDAQLVPKPLIELTSFVDAVIQATFEKNPRISAILTEGNQLLPEVDGLIKAFDQEKEFFVDARIKAENQEETFEVNAIVLLTTQLEPFVDARLQATFDEEFEVNAILEVPQPPVELEFSINASLKLENFRFNVNALLSTESPLETKVNAILTSVMEQEFFVNSILKKIDNDEEFEVNSILIDVFQKEFIIDAHIRLLGEEETFVNAVLTKDDKIKEFTISSTLVSRVGFETSAFIQALGINGNNGGSNPLAQNPFVGVPDDVGSPPVSTTSVPIGTNLCGQRLKLPAIPVIIKSFSFNLHRDGLSGSPTGTLQGIIYRNSVSGTPIIAGDILDTSDNIVNLGDLTTSITGEEVTFTFSTVEIFEDDDVFLGIEIIGTNEEVLFGTPPAEPIDGGDFTTTSTSTWGVDLGFDVSMLVLIDDEPRQRGSSVVNAILGRAKQEFIVGGLLKGNNIDQEFRIGAKLVILNSEEFTVGAILIGSIDFTIDAFIGEVQETILDVESVVVTNNSDSGTESTIGVGGI